jgi:hypothetical protein
VKIQREQTETTGIKSETPVSSARSGSTALAAQP